jgi:fucose 4-O-acetylase-like acetyltransferase
MFRSSAGWSWLETLGKASLLVYWVHVMLVYGDVSGLLHGNLTVFQSAAAATLLIILMVGLAEFRIRWKTRYRGRWRAGSTVAGPA